MSSSNKNSEIQYKAAPQGTVNLDEAQGIVECFVAGIGNKDSVGDVCAPGAFGKSLTRRKPRVVWGHNWNDPIGKVLDMYEVPPSDPRLPDKMKSAGIGGLYARVQFNLKSEKGREAFASVAFFGEEQEWSIGYKTINAKFDPQMQANILYEVELYEVSPVLHGANQLTGTISVKSEEQPYMVSVNDSPVLEGFDVTELSSVLDALKTLASISTDEQKGHGPMHGMMPAAMPGMPAPKPMHAPVNGPAPREVVKPEVPSMPENPMVMAIRRELAERTGSNVIIRSAVDNVVVFDRILSDGTSATYRLPFYYAGDEFMFGKPEKVNTQTVYVPEMPAMPGAAVQSNPYSFEAGKSLISFEDSAWGNGFNQSMPTEQVNASALNSVINNLQKLVEEKSTYVISVNIEDAFQVKQAIDPILSYYNVDAAVTEEGIVVKSLNKEFLDAVDVATKGVLRSLRNAVGRVNTPNIGSNRGNRTPNLASRGPGIGSRGAVVKLRDGSTWDPKSAPDKNRNGIVGEGLFDSSGRSLAQPDPTPAGPDSVRAPQKAPKAPKAQAEKLSSGEGETPFRSMDSLLAGMTPAQKKKFERDQVKFREQNRFPDGSGNNTLPWRRNQNINLLSSGERLDKTSFSSEDNAKILSMMKDTPEYQDLMDAFDALENEAALGNKRVAGSVLDVAEKEAAAAFQNKRNSLINRLIKSGDITPLDKPAKPSQRLSSGADDYFKKITKEKGPTEWADLSENDQIEFAYQLEDDFIYDRGFGDDAGVDALESGVYADVIQEYAEDWYNDELDKVKAPQRFSSGNTTPDENLIAMSLQEDLNPRVDDGKIDSGIAEAGKRIAARWSKLSKAKKNEAVVDKFDISIDDATNQEIIDTAIDLAGNEGLLNDLNLGRFSSGAEGRDVSYFEPINEEDSAYETASGLVKREMYKDYGDMILENVSDMLAPDSINSEQINEYIAQNIDAIIADMDNPENLAGLPNTPAARKRIREYEATVDSLKEIAKLPEEERATAFAKASQKTDMYDVNYSLVDIMEKDNSDFTKQFESSLIEDIAAQIRDNEDINSSEDGSYKRFSSGGMPDPEEEKELIAMAQSRAKNNNFEKSLADQYESKGRLSIKQWQALRDIANRFPKRTSTSKTDAPSAPFSRKPRKIIDIADVEEYGYPELPDNIKPTPEQGAAIDAMMTGADVKIRALAATGKTTTVINFANRLKNTEPGARVVYLVFNKNAKDDVEKRGMPTNVFVSTMDGISYRAMDALNPEMTKKSFSKKTGHIKPIKSFKDRAAYLGTRGLVTQGNELSDVDVFKRVSKAVDAFSISDDKEISKKHFTGAYNGKLAVDDDAILPEMISMAKKMWLDMNEPRVDGPDRKSKKGMLPISNMHLTKMWALTEPDIGQVAESNVAMIDEAQDMNPVFAGILRNSKNIQRIYIGDTNQAINAWRGADGKTLEDAEAVHDMPITDSFRFGKEVAAIGNRFLSLLGTKDRMTGRKTDRSGKPVDGIIGPVDNPTMILTRANGGAIAATMQVFANGGTVYGSKNFKTDLENFINNIEWMENGEKGKSFYTGLDGEKIFYAPEASQDLDGITSMAEFRKAIEQADNNRLNMLSKLMDKYSVAELRNALNKIITDKNKLPKNRDEYVHIQTAHTSKGLESPRVQIWTDFRGPKLDESGELVFPNEQELRLSYVAATRAEEQLDLGSLSWIFEHTSDADGESNTFSSGASRPRRQGGGKGRQEPWSAEDRQRFADRNVLRAQTRQGKKPEGPAAEEFSSGRFAPDGRGGSRLQRRLSSGEVKGPPPEGSKRYNSKEQTAATMSALHSEPGTALLLDSDKNILGALPKNKQSHVLNAEAAKRIIADPDNEYSAETGWPIDAGKLLDFVEVNQEDAVRTLREINDADAIASILGVQPKDAQDMLDGKPVYIPSNTAGEMLDRLKKENRYPEGIRGTNDVLRIWGYDGAPKWVRSSDIATPEFDLDEDGMVNWSEVKWDGLSKAEFDAEVARGKNPPEPVEVSPVEFFNSEAIYSNPKWDARAGSLKNPTVDEEFNAPTKKLKREEQLEPERFQSQKLAGSMVARADKDFMSEWRAGSHRINANQMMEILGIERTSEGASINTADARKLLMELNRIKQEAGGGLPLNSQGADGSFRPALESEIKKNPMTDEVMHALIASGKFKNMKEAVASLGDPRLDSLATEYDSRMLVDAALIRIKDQMNKAGAADQKKILAKAITSSLGRKTDLEKRVQEGRVSIKGIMTEDGMIGDEKISEIIDLVNAELSRRGLEKVDKDALFPKDEVGGFVSNLSAVLPGGRMSSGERFVARNASNRRAEAMSDAASRRASSPRLSSGEVEKAPSLTDANGKISPSNIGQAAKMATLSVPEINSKTSGENLLDFEKAVKTRAEIAKLFNINEKNTPGFSVYDFEDELKKSGFSEEESTEMVDRLRDLDNYIDEVESKFSEARDLMDDSLEKIQDNLDKVEKLKKEKTEAINRWGEEDAQVWVEAIDEKIADSMKAIDEAYENGIGGPSGEFGGLHSEVEDILKDNPGWKAPYGGKLRDINSRLVDVEMAISKAGGVKKPVPVTSIDFGVPDGTRLSSGKSDEYFQNLTSHLIGMIEKSQKEGGSWEAPWHKVENMPKNASTKNMYSGGNLFALMLASEEKGYATPQWSTFQQWKGLGATVKKGEKGTQILVPTMTFGDEIDPETGKKKRFVKGVYFKTAHVFNLDQVEGIDREEFLKTPTDMLSPEQKVSKLEEAIKEVGAVIKTGDGSKAYYSPSEDHVVMPPFELFKSPEGYYGVLAHELVHWTGHSSRLDRNNMNQFGSPDYAREELVAEFGSAFLLAMFGLSSEPRPDHAHYLANWLKVLRDEPNALQEASVKAQAAAKLLIGKMQSVIEDMGEVASDAESTVDVKSSQIFLDPLYGVKDAYMAWSMDSFNAPHFIKSLTERQTSSGLVNRSWERIAETAIFLERLSEKK